ncbi:MAG: circularly permuted type 2 ATP-grasp protein [Methylocystaceae bacterium]|nr:circularly permuted type 2 ATP-grasp protein [Methylocystaceae bacterium]
MPAPAEKLLKNYERVEGVSDELFDHEGNIRNAWQPFVNFFTKLGLDDIQRRIARGDQYLRDAGVFYRQYDASEASERDWPLSHIPVILGSSDWETITAGLKQRADLLEMVLADLYGPMNLVTNGYLPGELIARSSSWLRPMVGAQPHNGHFLNFVAFEIGRGPDGRWWVLGDRTQAPSGAGFALENRVATTHVFSDHYRKANVHRLAGFFKRFRDHLYSISRENDCGVGVLTPGRLNDGYFEHAYIARYLGFMLLEGEDITVRNGEAMVRTVDGLKPISVLWRRMDSSFVDPLELNSASMIGTPGLANVVKQGNLTMINSLGSGILETRSMLAFLPRIHQAINGTDLLLPNIATWWCGQEAERRYVLDSAEDMMFGPALSRSLPFEVNEMHPMSRDEDGQTLKQKIVENPSDFVAQETVKLSTTPVFEDNRLKARPMTIRVFLARTEQGWDVMPGGYARIGIGEGKTVLALQGGGKVADVWVSSKQHVEQETLGSDTKTEYVRKIAEVLPSRAADNLFWLGRYIERAEVLSRMTRAYHTRLEESDDFDTPLLNVFAQYLKMHNIKPDDAIPESICNALMSAMASAGHIRDRFSVDGWLALKDVSDNAWKFHKQVLPGDDTADAAQVLLRKISGFSGLVHDSMYHHTGWRFMKMGRALERAGLMASVLRHFIKQGHPVGSLDIPVDIGDSLMTHRHRYLVNTNRETVVDLLALDNLNPRSIIYQITECQQHLGFLPGEDDHRQKSLLSRKMLRLHTDLATTLPHQVTDKFLQNIENRVYEICDLISSTYLT